MGTAVLGLRLELPAARQMMGPSVLPDYEHEYVISDDAVLETEISHQVTLYLKWRDLVS